MKTFLKVFESTDDDKLADFLLEKLRSVMGDYYDIRVGIRNFLGEPTISVLVADPKPQNNIVYNSPVCTYITMGLTPRDGKFSWEASGHTARAVRFRTISSKTSPKDAIEKLVKWFSISKDNYDSIMKVGKYENI